MLEIRIAKEQEIEEIARLEQEIFPDPWSLKALGIPGTINRHRY